MSATHTHEHPPSTPNPATGVILTETAAKEVKKIITVPKIMIRPKTPPKEIVVEVVQIKEVLVEVTEPINTHLAEQLKAITWQ